MAGKRKSKRATENGGREVGVWPFGKKLEGKMVNPRRECDCVWILIFEHMIYLIQPLLPLLETAS